MQEKKIEPDFMEMFSKEFKKVFNKDFSSVFDAEFSKNFGDSIRTEEKTKALNVPVNFKKHNEYTRIEFEVPGYTKDDISIEFKNGILTVSGAKTMEDVENYASIQFKPKVFSMRIRIKVEIIPEEIVAIVKNGILMVDLKKAKQDTEVKINVS